VAVEEQRAQANPEPLVQLRDVFKIYREGTTETVALRGANLDLPRGLMTSMVGPSGSGKSTLLSILAGLALPSAGQVVLDGHDISRLDEAERARIRAERIGLVFQSGNLIPFLSAVENVQLARSLTGRPKATSSARELLADVGGVYKEYLLSGNVIRAVDGIDLVVEAGSQLAIVGPSGCGKSTLLGLIGGLEPPTAGRIWLGEAEVSSLSDAKRAELRRRSIGFVFQSYDLLPFLTATENIEFQLALIGADGGSVRARELVERLGLAEHAAKLPDQLSGGQRQRVGIARALANRPGLILADEPTGELDSESSVAAMDLLLEAQASLGATLVIVTHDPSVAARLDRVLTLRDGRVVSDPGRRLGPG